MGGMWDTESIAEHAKAVYKKRRLHGISELAFVLEAALREVWEGVEDLDLENPVHDFAYQRSCEADERIAAVLLEAVPDSEEFENLWDVDLYNIANYLIFCCCDN